MPCECSSEKVALQGGGGAGESDIARSVCDKKSSKNGFLNGHDDEVGRLPNVAYSSDKSACAVGARLAEQEKYVADKGRQSKYQRSSGGFIEQART